MSLSTLANSSGFNCNDKKMIISEYSIDQIWNACFDGFLNEDKTFCFFGDVQIIADYFDGLSSSYNDYEWFDSPKIINESKIESSLLLKSDQIPSNGVSGP